MEIWREYEGVHVGVKPEPWAAVSVKPKFQIWGKVLRFIFFFLFLFLAPSAEVTPEQYFSDVPRNVWTDRSGRFGMEVHLRL